MEQKDLEKTFLKEEAETLQVKEFVSKAVELEDEAEETTDSETVPN